MRTWKLKVIGKVQGVYFRMSSREEALRLGLRGWVKNTSDGAVSILVSGDREAYREFLKWVRKGPERAIVDHVVSEEINEAFSGDDFTIIR